MSSEPPESKRTALGEDQKWLLQFYSASKSVAPDETEPSGPLPDFAINPSEKYRVGDELGSGGMKSVLRTLDRNTDRNVALAVMRDSSSRRRVFIRFVREARITAALEHPNIVPVYDIGLDAEGKPFFTMKLLGGETLQSILQRVASRYGDYYASHPLNSLLQVFQGICNAVGFAHSRGVIHLDLKPANIQVGDFGEVLVLDWGLAKVFDADPILHPNGITMDKNLREVAAEGMVSGTPGFMSPEQERGEYASLDESTDIYALGAILHAILECRKSRNRAETPAALEAVAAKAMSPQPGQRYRTVAELARDVQAFVEGFATKAQQAGALTLLWLLFKRHFVVATLAATSLAAVFSILTVALVKIRRSEQVAIDALDKIKAEQELVYQTGLQAAPHNMQQAQEFMRLLDYDQAVTSLQKTVALDRNFNDAWWNLGAIYVGRQDFKQAAEVFTHLPKPDAPPPYSPPVDLQGVVEKYSAIRDAQGKTGLQKTGGDFVNDILHANHDSAAYLKIALVAFFLQHNRDPQTTDFGIIEKTLKSVNPDAKDLVFTHEYTPMGLKIGLHGDNVTEIFPLAGLPISVLDASGTGSMDLGWLHDAPLISVDLSGSGTWDLFGLKQNPTLQELRLVGWRKRDYRRLRDVPQLKRVIVNGADVADAKAAVGDENPPPQVTGE